MPWGDLLRTVLLTLVFGAPLALTLWALLDAARRPQWAWALAERSQVAWMTMILLGALLVCAGVGRERLVSVEGPPGDRRRRGRHPSAPGVACRTGDRRAVCPAR